LLRNKGRRLSFFGIKVDLGAAIYAGKVAISKLHLSFKDRIAAGNLLSIVLRDRLAETLVSYDNKDIFVLGVARGGVLVADVVARRLSAAHFDLVITRKLESPTNEEIAIGAVVYDGTTFLNEPVINSLKLSQQYVEEEKANQELEIKAIEELYSKERPEGYYHMIRDRTAVLVDDGAATGATIMATLRWLRTKQKPKRIIVAIPVAPRDVISILKSESDVVEAIITPANSNFRSIRQFYQEFSPVTDTQVMQIMQRRNLLAKQNRL
jgi:putative phosphoribosyl transferase